MSRRSERPTRIRPPAWRRAATAFVLALTLASSPSLLINAIKVYNVAFASLWFLGVFPAFLSALICYIGDPDLDRSDGFYWLAPVVLVTAVDCGAAVLLH